MSTRRLGTAVPTCAVVAAGGLSAWYLWAPAGLRLQVVVCWLSVALFASAMSCYAWRAGARMTRSDPRRRFWLTLAGSAAVFAAGEWAQVVTALVAPFSMAALTGAGVVRTAALGLGCTALTVVVLTYPIPHRSTRERLCYLLDLATVVTAAGAYGLYWVLPRSWDGHGVQTGDLLSVSAGPVVAMTTAFAVGRLFLSGVAPFRWHIGVLGPVAAGAEAVARALGPELVRAGRPGVIFTMTGCAHALLMIAAWSQYRSATGDPRPGRTRRRPFSLLPYLALAATFLLLVATLAVDGLNARTWVAVTGVAVTTGLVVARQLTAFVDNAHLLAERDALAARLHTMAFTDSLTGLANRALFHDRLAEMVRSAGPVAVLLIDLDDFKPVNDAYGHAAGDAVLVETAVRLRRGVREADVVARLGGDEFAVLIGGPEPGDLAATAARIVRDIAEPVAVDGARQVTVRASVGVTTTCGGADPSTLLKAADEAMYRAKCAGKGSFHLAGRA